MQLFINCFAMNLSLRAGIMLQNIKHANKKNSNDKISYRSEDILGIFFYEEKV